MIYADGWDSAVRELSCIRGPAPVGTGHSPATDAVSTPRAEGPVATLVLKEFLARGATGVAHNCGSASIILCLLGVLLVILIRTCLSWRILADICTVSTFLILLILPLYPSPLRASFTIVCATAAVVLPLNGRTYEGIERAYLCPPKCGLGLTQTSNS